MADSTPALKKILSKFQSKIVAFNDNITEMDDLLEIQSSFEDLLDDFFSRISKIDHNVLNAIYANNKLSNIQFMANAECYIIEQVYDMLYYKLTTVLKSKDEELTVCLKLMKCLDLCQMGVDWKYGYNVVSAVGVLQHLSSLRTPIEKIECLVKCIKTLAEPFEIGKASQPLNTDQLIPLILFVVIRSDIMHLSTNLHYIRHFSFEHDINSGYHGYSLSCFEAVVHYALENTTSLKILSDRNYMLWNAIFDNKTEDFENIVGSVDCLNLKTPTSVHIYEKSKEEQDFESLLSRNYKGDNPLLLAVRYERFEMVKRLLKNQANVNTRNYQFESPLFLASSHQSTIIADYLLSRVECDPNLSNERGVTPFLNAVVLQNVEMIGLYMKYETVDINFQDNDGNSAWHITTIKTAPYLLKCNPNLLNKDSLTPLMFHLKYENIDILMILLRHKDINLNTTNDLGQTVLHHASASIHLINFLRCDPNIEDYLGNNALMYSTSVENTDILLEMSSDPTCKNLFNKSAIDIIVDKDHADDYALFFYKQEQKRVTRIVRVKILDGILQFIIKSGNNGNVKSITTTTRTFDDLVFLVTQLQHEWSEVCLPSITYPIELSPVEIRKSIRKINHMLDYLISHPRLSTHLTTTNFLSKGRIDRIPIIERTELNIAIMLDHIYKDARAYPDGNADRFRRIHHQVTKLSIACTSIVGNMNQYTRCYFEFMKDCKKLGALLTFSPRYLTLMSIQYQQIQYIQLQSALILDFQLQSVIEILDKYEGLYNDYHHHVSLTRSFLLEMNSSSPSTSSYPQVCDNYESCFAKTRNLASLLAFTDLEMEKEITIYGKYRHTVISTCLLNWSNEWIRCEREILDSIISLVSVL